ncbi:MAG: hypothetical protein HRU82_18730 [Nitrospira sp.]|nr:MAG: hypothetical protein HRU82_18730 [Nitrospira sp.]
MDNPQDVQKRKPRWGRMLLIAAFIGAFFAGIEGGTSKGLEHILVGGFLGVLAFLIAVIIIHTNDGFSGR